MNIVATYDYQDETGALLYQSVRDELKNFKLRRPRPGADPGEERWIDNLNGVRRVLYRLPQVRVAVEQQQVAKFPQPIFVVEGEKDADNLEKLGLIATTNEAGASNWRPEHTSSLIGATDVVILPDNDKAGEERTQRIAAEIGEKVHRVRILRLPGLPEKGDVSDWIESGGTREQLLALAAASPNYDPPAARLLRVSIGGWDLLNKDIPEPRSVIGAGVFCEGDLGFVIGEGGAGKSQLSLQLAVARALSREWIGFKVEPGRTGLLMLELDDWTWKQRIRVAAGDGASDALNAIRVVCRPDLTGVLDLANDAGIAALERWIRSEGLSLVFLDPLSRTHGLDENKANEMGPFLQRLDALRIDSRCAIVVNHHTRKSQGSKGRESGLDAGSGSRVFRDFPSFHAHLERRAGTMRVLNIGKASRAAEPKPIWLLRTETGVLEVTDSPEKRGADNEAKVRDALLEAGTVGLTREEVEARTGLKKSAILKHIQTLGAFAAGKPPRYRLSSTPPAEQLEAIA